MIQIFKMAFRDLGRNRRRSFFSALALGLGMAILLLMASVFTGELRGSTESSIKLSSGHIQVRAETYKDNKTSLAWKDLLEDPYQLASQIAEMLQAGKWMFDQAYRVLMREQDWEPVADPLYDRDKQINLAEQRIRERIVTHLSVGNQADLAACLALMSIVKDAERIGDYCKNIFEVGRFYRNPYKHDEYSQPLRDIQHQVLDMFDPTREAFVNSDDDLAEQVVDTKNGLSKQCDMVTTQLLQKHDNLQADEAVAHVLLARHYKRVAGHLANIATSVISPLPMLDFQKR